MDFLKNSLSTLGSYFGIGGNAASAIQPTQISPEIAAIDAAAKQNNQSTTNPAFPSLSSYLPGSSGPITVQPFPSGGTSGSTPAINVGGASYGTTQDYLNSPVGQRVTNPPINATPPPAPSTPSWGTGTYSVGGQVRQMSLAPNSLGYTPIPGESNTTAPWAQAAAAPTGSNLVGSLTYIAPTSTAAMGAGISSLYPYGTSILGGPGSFSPSIMGGSAASTVSPDEEKRRRAQQAGVQTIQAGQVAPGGVTAPAVAPPLNVDYGALTGQFDAQRVTDLIAQTATMMGNANISQADFANLMQTRDAAIQSLATNLNAQHGQNPTIDSFDVKNYLDQLPQDQKIGTQEYVDQIKQSIGLNQIESQALQLIDSISATNQVYNRMITEIRDNPNLPKGLANRRIQTLVNQQSEQVQAMQGQLEQLTQLWQFGNQKVEMALDIYKTDLTQQERDRQAIQQMFGVLAENGGLVGMDTSQAQYWSRALGLPEATVQQMVKAANRPNSKVITPSDGGIYIQSTNPQTGEISLETLKAPSVGTGLTPNQQINAEMSLQSKFDRATTAQNTISSQVQIMNSAWERIVSGQARDLNATGQGIVVTFNKILDPGSVVRESEYARSGEGVSLIQRIQGIGTRIMEGGPKLTRESLKEFVETANTFANNAYKNYEAEKQKYRDYANQYGLNTTLLTSPTIESASSASGRGEEQADNSWGTYNIDGQAGTYYQYNGNLYSFGDLVRDTTSPLFTNVGI